MWIFYVLQGSIPDLFHGLIFVLPGSISVSWFHEVDPDPQHWIYLSSILTKEDAKGKKIGELGKNEGEKEREWVNVKKDNTKKGNRIFFLSFQIGHGKPFKSYRALYVWIPMRQTVRIK